MRKNTIVILMLLALITPLFLYAISIAQKPRAIELKCDSPVYAHKDALSRVKGTLLKHSIVEVVSTYRKTFPTGFYIDWYEVRIRFALKGRKKPMWVLGWIMDQKGHPCLTEIHNLKDLKFRTKYKTPKTLVTWEANGS